MIRLIDLQKKKYGKLRIIGEAKKPITCADKRRHSRYLLCKCDCGKTHITEMQRLRNGITRSCGCLKHIKGKEHRNWNGFGLISGSIINNIRKNAKTRNIKFNLTARFLHYLFLKQNQKCALSGIDLIIPQNYHKNKGTASIDRINSSKGYIKGNVQWVHKNVNKMKNNINEKEFLNLCLNITKKNYSNLFGKQF